MFQKIKRTIFKYILRSILNIFSCKKNYQQKIPTLSSQLVATAEEEEVKNAFFRWA